MKRFFLAVVIGLGVSTTIFAQDPGAQQDAIAERQKLLRASDQLDLLTQQNMQISQQNSQLVQQNNQLAQDITSLQDRVQKMETANADLKNQLAQQQKDWATEKERLLKEVSKIVASGGKAKPASDSTSPSVSTTPTSTGTAAATTSGTTTTATASGTTATTTETGYEYVVQPGQSLWAIASAYQKSGVNVSVDDIRKANHLGKNDALKAGQKLFIPKK